MASIKANCRKVICIGRNYADHISELSSARPKQPFFFLKPPSSILAPSKTAKVIRPRGVSLHYEVELGLTIASASALASAKQQPNKPNKPNKPIHNLTPSALSSLLPSPLISSYVLTIDMTARNVQDEAKRKGLPWSIAKGFDTFLPISEPIPLAKIPDPHDVELWLSVNGTMRQDDSTSLMLFRIPRILSDVSKVMTLEEGDLVLTGTPKGVGEVKGGDVMRCGVRVGGEDLQEARLEVEVVDAEDVDEEEEEEEEGAYVFRET